jgi:hypothetical protein
MVMAMLRQNRTFKYIPMRERHGCGMKESRHEPRGDFVAFGCICGKKRHGDKS